MILSDATYEHAMKEKLATIQGKLGGGGASRNIAELVDQLVR
jgi:hypothetical protein